MNRDYQIWMRESGSPHGKSRVYWAIRTPLLFTTDEDRFCDFQNGS